MLKWCPSVVIGLMLMLAAASPVIAQGLERADRGTTQKTSTDLRLPSADDPRSVLSTAEWQRVDDSVDRALDEAVKRAEGVSGR